MSEELCIEVDRENNVVGLLPRSSFLSGEHIHRTVALLLFNSRGEVLRQKRSLSKKTSPGLYTFSVSGYVGDESYDDAIVREACEEIGIEIVPKRYDLFYKEKDPDSAWVQVYTAVSDEDVTLETGEVDALDWLTLEDINIDVRKHPEMYTCLLYTSPSPRDKRQSRMPSSA